MSLLIFRSKGVNLDLGNLTGGTVNGTNRTGFVGTSHTLPTHSRPHTSHALSIHSRPPSPHTPHFTHPHRGYDSGLLALSILTGFQDTGQQFSSGQ